MPGFAVGVAAWASTRRVPGGRAPGTQGGGLTRDAGHPFRHTLHACLALWPEGCSCKLAHGWGRRGRRVCCDSPAGWCSLASTPATGVHGHWCRVWPRGRPASRRDWPGRAAGQRAWGSLPGDGSMRRSSTTWPRRPPMSQRWQFCRRKERDPNRIVRRVVAEHTGELRSGLLAAVAGEVRRELARATPTPRVPIRCISLAAKRGTAPQTVFERPGLWAILRLRHRAAGAGRRALPTLPRHSREEDRAAGQDRVTEPLMRPH